MLGIHLTGLQNGDIQQQRKVLVGRVQIEHDALAILVELDLGDVGKAALIEVALPGGLVGGQHIVGRHPGAVGEPGVVVHIEGIDGVVGIDPIPGTQNGRGLVIAVVGEQALIHQGKQHPVGEVHADNGVHGPVGIVGQNHGLVRQRILFRGVRIVLHENGVAGGHIGLVLFGGGAAGNERRQGREHQQHRKQSFHRFPPVHRITAP